VNYLSDLRALLFLKEFCEILDNAHRKGVGKATGFNIFTEEIFCWQ